MSERSVPQLRSQTNRQRKQEQLAIVLNKDIDCKDLTTGLENYQFIHQALPEIDLTAIDLSVPLFRKRLAAPLVISSMVGGTDAARQINQNLGQAVQTLGLAMGLGSQRCALEEPATALTYEIRDIAPDILLFANLGAVQLNYGYGISECLQAIKMVGADALILHLNPLQEAIQPDGNTNFAGLLDKIGQVCLELPLPVIVKEVGYGISEDVARMLANVGVAGIEVAGAGGTSWSEVERHRARSKKDNNIAASFASWGISTAESTEMVRQSAPELTLIASGGIRTGLDVAKALALGADATGIALPMLKAARSSAEAVAEALQEIIEELRISMFCIGAANISKLKDTPFLKRKPKV